MKELAPKKKPGRKKATPAELAEPLVESEPAEPGALVVAEPSEPEWTLKLFMPTLTPMVSNPVEDVGDLLRSESEVSQFVMPQHVPRAKAKAKKATSFCVS